MEEEVWEGKSESLGIEMDQEDSRNSGGLWLADN